MIRRFLKRVFNMKINRYVVENGVTELYCKHIMDGRTHAEAIKEIEFIVNVINDELDKIEGR